jgi:hypothetical protein
MPALKVLCLRYCDDYDNQITFEMVKALIIGVPSLTSWTFVSAPRGSWTTNGI